jgi:2-keto-4-pentenoate hydratase/2-oxohepta-3-ene-1,7-dioic acid hydratase in catechol pathway
VRLLRVGELGREIPAVSADGLVAYDLSDRLPNAAGFADPRNVELAEEALAAPEGLRTIDLSTVRIAAPLVPGKIVGVGLNYRKHAAEARMPIPAEPILFLKATDTVNAPGDDVLIPIAGEKTDYEVELAVVIGRTARYLPSPARALDSVLGYAIADDVSERAFQLERGGQWDKGKNCETFSPLGPFIVTADEVPDPGTLGLGSSVNGVERQSSTTADMIFPVPYLIWYISQFMALLPGDVVLTGTPAGVGAGFDPPRFLRDGDVVRTWIDGLGSQEHRFVAAVAAERRAVA